MLSRTVLERFPVRKTERQKERFRDWLCGELEGFRFGPRLEHSGSRIKSCNVVVGDPERAELLLTAHYDTAPVLPFSNLIFPRDPAALVLYQVFVLVLMLAFGLCIELALLLVWHDAPQWLAVGSVFAGMGLCLWWMLFGRANRHNANDNTSGVLTLLETLQLLSPADKKRVCIVFFDNEEKGLLGSRAFAKAHPGAARTKLVLNFDCVGEGTYLHLFPNKPLKAEEQLLSRLEEAFRGREDRTVHVCRDFGLYPSDQCSFVRGVGVCALKKKRLVGYYIGKLHTGQDRTLEEENLMLLREGIMAYLKQTAEERQK